MRGNKKVGNENVKAIGLDHSKRKKKKNRKVVSQGYLFVRPGSAMSLCKQKERNTHIHTHSLTD